MEDKATFFPAYSPEAYELALDNIEMYEKIIPVESRTIERKGLKKMFGRRKKRNEKI